MSKSARKSGKREPQSLAAENAELRRRLAEADQALEAIRNGDIDAIVVQGAAGPKTYTLQEASEPYRQIVEQMSEAAVTMTAHGLIVFCNEAYAQLVGAERVRLVGSLALEFIAPEALATLLSTSRGVDLAVVRGDGVVLDCYASASRLPTAGEPLYCCVITNLTGQRLRARYEKIVQAASHAICDLTHDLVIASWNPGAERIYGYTRSEILGRSARELSAPGHERDFDALAARAAEGDGPVSADLVRRRKNGALVHLTLALTPLRDERGALTGFASICYDITERKAAEEALRQSEERLRLALEGADLGAWDVDLQTGAAIWNRRHAELQGYPRTDGPTTMERWRERVHPSDLDHVMTEIEQARCEHKPVVLEHRLHRADTGEERWLSLYGRFTYDEAGKAVRFSGVSRDITEQKGAEAALARSEQRVKLALADSPMTVFEQDAELRYQWLLNSKLGYSDTDAIGKTDEELMDPVAAALLTAFKREVLRSGESARQEVMAAVPGQPMEHFDLHVHPRRDESGRVIGVTCVSTDITQRKRFEQELSQRNRQLDLLARTSGLLLLSADAPPHVLEQIFGEIAEQIDMEMVYYFRPGDEPRVLRLDLSIGVEARDRERFATMRLGELLCGRVAEQRQRLIVEDLQQSTQPGSEVLRAAGATSYAGFPLVANGELIGTVAFVSAHRTRLREGDIQVIQAICDQIAVTIARRQAEQRLKASEQAFRQLVENSPFGVYAVDADFRLILVGEGAQNVFKNVRPLIGRDLADVLRIIWAEPFASECISRFRHTLKTGEPYHAASTVERRADVGKTEAYDWKVERIVMPDGRYGAVCHFYDLSERQAHQAKIEMLMREVNHRAKNMLSLVQAVATQTAASGADDFLERFGTRVRALAASQDLLVQTDWEHAELSALIRCQLLHFEDLVGTRIQLCGPEISLSPRAAQTLGMAVHEMATNAAKYGALSNDKGQINIHWKVTPNAKGPTFTMTWIESDGPQVTAPTRTGFGQRVAKSMVEAAFGCHVTLDYPASGFKWLLECKLGVLAVSLGDDSHPRATAEPSDGGLLIVEDDVMLGLDLAQSLQSAGHKVMGPARSVADAMALLERHTPSFAILDIDLGGETSEPIARYLQEQRVPIVSISGYAEGQRPGAFQDIPFLSKPLHLPSLMKEVERATVSV